MKKSSEKVLEKFLNGYNCSQSVLCGFCEKLGLDEETAYRLSEGFGHGIAGWEDECGAVTGMAMLLGLDNSAGIPSKGATKMDTYERIREAGETFAAECGSIKCGDLLALEDKMQAEASEEEKKAARDRKLICIKCVKAAADILDEKLRTGK